MNPLLQQFDTAPFSKIKEEHYESAIKKAIELAKNDITEIVKNTEKSTFENTVVALDNSGEQLDRITSIFFNLNSAETNAKIQEIAKMISPWLSEFKNDIMLNEQLFERVKSVYEQKESLNGISTIIITIWRECISRYECL